MPHSFNRTAFDAGRVSGNALLDLYCSLVCIEIALKDRSNPWKKGHLLAQWLAAEGDAGLTSLTQQLVTGLAAMKCTDRDGNSSGVRLDAFPDLRYLRYVTDFPGESTDTQLQACVTLVRDIEAVLRGKGIL
jgi:hypothetical protein